VPLVKPVADAIIEGRWSSQPGRGPNLDYKDEKRSPETLGTSRQAATKEVDKTDAQKLDAIVEKYVDKIPKPLGRFIQWMRKPELRWLRLIVGVLFVIFGFVGFLPILGFWMVPLGLIILAQDSKWLQRPTLKAITWLEGKLRR